MSSSGLQLSLGDDTLLAQVSLHAPVQLSVLAEVMEWCMVSGKARFDSLDNARYPQITAQPLADFVRG